MSIFLAIRTYFIQVIAELRKVSFPTYIQVLRRTVVVIVSISALTLFIAIVDAGITELLKVFVFK